MASFVCYFISLRNTRIIKQNRFFVGRQIINNNGGREGDDATTEG